LDLCSALMNGAVTSVSLRRIHLLLINVWRPMNLLLLHRSARFDLEAQAAALQRGGPVLVEAARQSLKMRAQQTIHSASATLFCIAIVTVTYYFFVPLWRIAGWV